MPVQQNKNLGSQPLLKGCSASFCFRLIIWQALGRVGKSFHNNVCRRSKEFFTQTFYQNANRSWQRQWMMITWDQKSKMLEGFKGVDINLKCIDFVCVSRKLKARSWLTHQDFAILLDFCYLRLGKRCRQGDSQVNWLQVWLDEGTTKSHIGSMSLTKILPLNKILCET